jgi:hypothetical protein
LAVPHEAYTRSWRAWKQSALCGVVLAGLCGVLTVAALVELAGCLARYAQTKGYFWPADTQLHRMIDERG